MLYNFFDETIDFELHPDNELTSNLIREYGCSVDMKDINAYRHFIKPDDIVIDVGANIGWNTCFLAKFLKNTGSVYAFEPDKSNFQLLSRNINANGLTNVKLMNCALSDKIDDMKLYHSITNYGNHVLNPTIVEQHEHVGYDIVPVLTFDDFIELENIDPSKISLIKLDIQGHEANFFLGAKRFFSKYRPVIMIEYAPFHIKLVGSSPFEIMAFIDKHEYGIYVINNIDETKPEFGMYPSNCFNIIYQSPEMFMNRTHTDLCLIYEGK